MRIRPREPVIFAVDFPALVAWYRDTLGFAIVKQVQGDYHYANLESADGVKLGIASAAEMGKTPGDRTNNTAVLQVEVEDVKAFLAHVAENGGTAPFGPSHDTKDDFWFGAIADCEGNQWWVVDPNCP